MAPLVTKTVRLREDQEIELTNNYKLVSSSLFRRLFDIYLKSDMPGAEIIKLRKELREKAGT